MATLAEIKARAAACANRKHESPMGACPVCFPSPDAARVAISDREWLLQALERAKRHAASARARLKAIAEDE